MLNVQTIGMTFIFTRRRNEIAMNMEGCELRYGMHDCDLDHMHNFHHDGNIGNFLSHKALGYCDNSRNFLCSAFELTKIETKRDIESCPIGIFFQQLK